MGALNNRQEIQSRTQRVFQQVFEESTLVVSEQTVAADIPKWDSLTHISLILALEEEFGIEFSSEEIVSMSRVGDLFSVLEAKEVTDGGV